MTIFLYYNSLLELSVQSSLWLAKIFCLCCLLPQILTNYKQKCGRGISAILLIGYLNAFIFLIFFIFLRNLPIAYKVVLPLETLAVLVLIFQRLYYNNNVKKYRLALALNLLAFVFFIPCALSYPLIIGSLCGWINFVLSTFYQLPQIIKIQKEKSVEGFNFLFVVFNGFASIIEIATWYLGYLPAQTCFSAIRALLVCLVICGQFYYFRKRTGVKEQRQFDSLTQNSKLMPN